MDEYPQRLGKRRELFVLGLITVSFLGSLATLTNVSSQKTKEGRIVCRETAGRIWGRMFDFSGGLPRSHRRLLVLRTKQKRKTNNDSNAPTRNPQEKKDTNRAQQSSSSRSQFIIASSLSNPLPLTLFEYRYPDWSISVGYLIGASSFLCIPLYMAYKLLGTPGSLKQEEGPCSPRLQRPLQRGRDPLATPPLPLPHLHHCLLQPLEGGQDLWEALKEKTRAKTKGESFESYEVAYMRLLKLTENGDIDRLVDEFIKKEKKNFAAFSYITELNDDNERLQKKIQDVQQIYGNLQMFPKSTANPITDNKKSIFLLHLSLGSRVKLDPALVKLDVGSDICKNVCKNLQKGIIEKKANHLLLIETFLRYKEIEGELEAAPIQNPFLGGTALLSRVESIRELEEKIEKQKKLVFKRKQEYDGKRLQKQINLLENRLNHVSSLAKIRAKLPDLQNSEPYFQFSKKFRASFPFLQNPEDGAIRYCPEITIRSGGLSRFGLITLHKTFFSIFLIFLPLIILLLVSFATLQSTVYYDTILAKNAQFREEIESLQKQKSVFDHIFSRLQQKLEEQKRAMEVATEQATQAREQRSGV
ncbi:hypothetical protein JD844_015252 [Phrynosoma platyrhinos]|uniref:ODAD1 central coiled coil region domain-containing protein n=1 Tax=Phrynosoma platyrhinos TaxID=52577 RepID=A0ABQ7T8S5_PHRPL|nr:hypothetical protein JD844_015252 [Phrynosoma platyrhinos]